MLQESELIKNFSQLSVFEANQKKASSISIPNIVSTN